MIYTLNDGVASIEFAEKASWKPIILVTLQVFVWSISLSSRVIPWWIWQNKLCCNFWTTRCWDNLYRILRSDFFPNHCAVCPGVFRDIYHRISLLEIYRAWSRRWSPRHECALLIFHGESPPIRFEREKNWVCDHLHLSRIVCIYFVMTPKFVTCWTLSVEKLPSCQTFLLKFAVFRSFLSSTGGLGLAPHRHLPFLQCIEVSHYHYSWWPSHQSGTWFTPCTSRCPRWWSHIDLLSEFLSVGNEGGLFLSTRPLPPFIAGHFDLEYREWAIIDRLRVMSDANTVWSEDEWMNWVCDRLSWIVSFYFVMTSLPTGCWHRSDFSCWTTKLIIFLWNHLPVRSAISNPVQNIDRCFDNLWCTVLDGPTAWSPRSSVWTVFVHTQSGMSHSSFTCICLEWWLYSIHLVKPFGSWSKTIELLNTEHSSFSLPQSPFDSDQCNSCACLILCVHSGDGALIWAV